MLTDNDKILTLKLFKQNSFVNLSQICFYTECVYEQRQSPYSVPGMLHAELK